MSKKIVALLLCFICCVSVLFSGCSEARRIDTAALAENVTVDTVDGKTVYTFFLLSSEDKPCGIDVPADSFEEACDLAENRYIPNISLARIDMIMINKELYKDVMKSDIEYISTQPVYSPNLKVTLCDSNTVKRMKEEKRVPEIIDNELMLTENSTEKVNTTCLSIFNSFSESNDDFSVAYISAEKELKIETMKIRL